MMSGLPDPKMTSDDPKDLPEDSAAPCPEAIEAFCHYLHLLELGQEVDWEAFCGDHSDHRCELYRLLGEYERVTAILDRLAPAASFSARLRAHYGDSVDPGISLDGDGARGSSRKGTTTTGTGRILSRLSAQSPETTRYEAKREIARGGMGAIIEVWDAELRRTLAMKVVLTSRSGGSDDSDSEDLVERRLSRFLEEAQITGQLDHPGIVPVHDIGLDDQGRVYFTMQLIDGLDLRKVFELARLQKEGWTEHRVIAVLTRVCEAMAFAHSKGVIHRDLKPANIMVGRFGEAYVMDWGLAKVLGRDDPRETIVVKESEEESRRVKTDRSDSDTGTNAALKTLDGDIVGTPAYMAPEQARGKLGEIGRHSDVYSMGAMIYHLLTGHMPYEPLGEKVPAHTILEAVRKAPPWPLQQLNPDVDAELGAICAKAMSREPSSRYGDMMALAEDLRAWIEGRSVGAYTTGVLYEARKWIVRNKTTTVALGAILGLILISISLLFWQQQNSLGKLADEQAATEEERNKAEIAKAEAIDNLQTAKDNEKEADVQRERALAESQLAKEATILANEAATNAQRQTELALAGAYRLSISAASYNLRLDDVLEAKKNLEECRSELRSWEWGHLDLSADESLGTNLVLKKGITDLAVSADGETLLTYGFGLLPELWSVKTRHLVGQNISLVGFLGLDLDLSRLDLLRCALSPDGAVILVTSVQDNSVRVFNPGGGEMYSWDEHTEPVTCVQFSSDGSRIATSGEDGRAFVFDTSLARIECELIGHEGAVTCVALSPAGTKVATGGVDRTLRVWETATGKELQRLEGHHTGRLSALAWSTDGELLVSASTDETLAVWRIEGGVVLAVMHGHRGAVTDVVFGVHGASVFSTGEDLTVRKWDSRSGRLQRVFHGHDKAVWAIVRLGDGNRIATASLDGTVRVWDGDWNPAVSVLDERGSFRGVIFTPDGRTLFANPAEGTCWEIDADSMLVERFPGTASEGVPATSRTACVSRNGRWLALSPEGVTVEVWDLESGEKTRVLTGFRREIEMIDFSADGRLLACGGAREVYVENLAEAEGRETITLRYSLAALAISADGTTLATAENDESLRLWNPLTGDAGPARRKAHKAQINDLVFSADGTLLATASNDGTTRVFGTDDLTVEQSFSGHRESIRCVAFHPTAPRLATGSSDGSIRLWDTESGEAILVLTGHHGSIEDVDFSPDGYRLASCGIDAGVRIWETNRADERYELRRRVERGESGDGR
jgi:eukaryotic-like serine/threonine-protein kinase